MELVEQMAKLPSIATRELESLFLQKKSKKRREHSLLPLQSEVDVVEPFYFSKHEKICFSSRSKCLGCEGRTYTST